MSHIQIELQAWQDQPLPPALTAPWRAVATHTHNVRSEQLDVDAAAAQLLQWCRHHDVQAVGLGSPWEPVSRASYKRYEGADRDRYYADEFDPTSVMDHDSIQAYFQRLNAQAEGSTLFYPDNETPKCRYGHLWWFGYDYDRPAWHDYSQDRPIWYHDGDAQCELNPLTGRPHTRRAYLEIVAHQRSRGARGVWAHPTSWWTQGPDAAFVTNIAAECVQHLWIDGRLDGLAVSGYQAYRPQYQSLWYSLLDTGAVVPGFAETDTCFDRANLLDDTRVFANQLHLPHGVSATGIRDAAAAGACVFGSGGLLLLDVDGVGSGGRVESGDGQTHRVTLWVQPRPGQRGFSRVELIGPGGTVLWTGEHVAEGKLEFRLRGVDGPAYLLARAWGEPDAAAGRGGSESQPAVEDHQVCNPVYLQPRGFALAPMQTDVDLSIAPDSPWRGGALIAEDAAGETLERVSLRAADRYRARLPASARIRLQHPEQGERVFYLLMENPKAQALSRYLYDGWFRRDFPDSVPGEVPISAFHVQENREVLAQLRKQL